MKNRQHETGSGEANNSSNQNIAGINSPANNSYQQSLYIAAISKFIGCEGLCSPVTDTRDGIKYTFDFYHPECGKMFKVFRADALSEYEQYALYPGEKIIIVDADNCNYQVGECACCEELLLILPHKIGEQLHDTDSTLVYFKQQLWEFRSEEKDGTSLWRMIVPAVLQEVEDAEDSCED